MPRLFDYDYKPGEEFSVRFNLRDAKPVGEETTQHLRNAMTEVLRAMRSGLDRAITTLERDRPASTAESYAEDESRHRRIDVE